MKALNSVLPILAATFFFSPFVTTAFAATKPVAHREMDVRETLDYSYKFYVSEEEDDAQMRRFRKLSQTQIWNELESNGWPEALGDFQVRFRPGKSYLTLFKKLPLHAIDMRSPDRFKNSMVAGEITGKPSIGHMSVGWSCAASPTSNEGRHEGFAAQTGEDGGQQSQMLNDGWGVTSMLSTFTDGSLQNGREVQEYFATQTIERHDDGVAPNVHFAMVVEVPTSECEQARTFVKSYVLHPTKPYHNFGMMVDPSKFEGGGCGSFAISVLAHAPSLKPLTSTFWRELAVPARLLGLRQKQYLPNDVTPTYYAKDELDEHLISKLRLIGMNWDKGRLALRAYVVDPELTIFSLRLWSEIAIQNSPNALTKYQRGHLEGLRRVYNFANRHGDDVMPEDKDSGYQEIDRWFDPSFEKVGNAVDRWWYDHKATHDVHLVSIPLGLGMMIESKPTPVATEVAR